MPSSKVTRSASGPLPGRGGAAGCAFFQRQPATAGQMHRQVQPADLEVEELAVPLHPVDGHPVQGVRRRVVRLEHVDRHGVHPGHRVSDRAVAQDVDEGLHLGEFRHRPSVPRRRPITGGNGRLLMIFDDVAPWRAT